MGTCSVSSLTGCALSSHTRWCPGVPGVTLHSHQPAALTLAMAKAQQAWGSSLRVGTCFFRHVDTSGDVLCLLLVVGNNSSGVKAPNCV